MTTAGSSLSVRCDECGVLIPEAREDVEARYGTWVFCSADCQRHFVEREAPPYYEPDDVITIVV